ncbi:Alpha beta hydrolase fold protein [Lasiodiplodia theobromae]|uniref:Alpha beta hydrolase fold protein n=1 Tax=Lasiodiplodia theobromae TaxID=45133 RepID=UPI0015C2FE30|nr:Alpha beta hydrolase fold protein [Lasiodiplodia theobromae]KAF4541827.1 Alpha beta hydrolase fold protein [Lasiodiplodia theobromae]
MDKFAKKTFTTSRSLTYTYYDSARPTDDPHKPVFFLLHGFPDNAHLWKEVIPHLLPLPNRIIVPDQLGYGSTSRPTDAALFNSKDLTADYVELLRAEHVTSNVVVVGHDWGSFSAQRVWLWAPELVVGVALLNVAYIPPSETPFDLAAANAFFEQATGLPRYAYWELFTAEDGAEVCDKHLESLWHVAHGNRPNWMRDMFCVRGAMREFLLADRRDVELHEYAKPGNGWREEWLQSVREGGGLASALCCYKALAHNHHYEVEKELPKERIPVTVPTFFLGCDRDDVCLSALIEKNRADGHVGPDLTVKNIDSAHWCPMEKPDEVGKALYEWLSSKF